jgi:hypothetical protein
MAVTTRFSDGGREPFGISKRYLSRSEFEQT